MHRAYNINVYIIIIIIINICIAHNINTNNMDIIQNCQQYLLLSFQVGLIFGLNVLTGLKKVCRE